MNSTQISTIELKAADELRNVFGDILNFPIDLSKIADSHGISLQQASFPDSNALGQLDQTKKTIFVSKDNMPFERMAFTIAHELGHLVIHGKQKDTYWRRQFLDLEKQDVQEEREADCFAGALLMPESYVKKFWTLTTDIAVLSKIFGVSNSAMGWRLRNMGLIDLK